MAIPSEALKRERVETVRQTRKAKIQSRPQTERAAKAVVGKHNRLEKVRFFLAPHHFNIRLVTQLVE